MQSLSILATLSVVFLSVVVLADVAHHSAAAETVESVVIAKPGVAEKLKAPPKTWDNQCYVCNTRNDAGCERPGEHHKKDCNSSAVGCWKLYQQVEYDQEFDLKAHYRIVRQCAYHRPEGAASKVPCVYRSGFGGMSTYCFCNHTTCNWAITSLGGASPIMTIVATAFCLLIAKFVF